MIGPAGVVYAVAHRLLVVPSQPAAPLGAWGLCVLEAQAREHGDASSPALADHLSHLVGALLAGDLHHAHDPPVDIVLPDLLRLPYDPPNLAVVEVDVSIPQAQHQQVYARAEYLVHRLAELGDAHRRLDALAVEVVGVVVVDQPGAEGPAGP